MTNIQLTISSSFQDQKRTVHMVIGRRYVVKPLNPRKTKNRERECVLLDIVLISSSHPDDMVAKVRYMDNNRVGRADFGDLEPLDEKMKGENF